MATNLSPVRNVILEDSHVDAAGEETTKNS